MPDHKDNVEANTRFTELSRARCPATLPAAVERAAARQCMKSSEYIRRSVIDRLKADGFDIASLASVA